MENEESMKKESKERKKTVSLKQLEANRRNARLSTGPKTIAGQRKVRWNALKHGLLAAEVVIPAGDGQENRRQFQLLLDQLRRDLQPQGTLEEMLVEKVAVCYWRQRRLLRYETGHIREDLDTARSQKAHWKLNAFDLDQGFSASGLPVNPGRFRNSSLGLQYLIEQLDEMRREVETTGSISEKTCERLVQLFGRGEQDLPARIKRVELQDWSNGLLQALDGEKARLEQLKPQVQQQEQLKDESYLARLSLPKKESLDNLLRYETSLERQLDRILRQLGRLQKQRLWRETKGSLNFAKQSHLNPIESTR
jgi:hypothetical protein